MLKIRFKNSSGCPAKKVQVFNNKVTVVTLTGYLKVDSWIYNYTIWDWASHHPSVDVSNDIARMNFILKVSGKSTCTEGDKFSPVYGERIVEARAKIKLYKFMCRLLSKAMGYHRDLLFGNCEISNVTYSHSKPPKPCLYTNYKKYLNLWEKECEHLNNLLNMS